MMVDWKDDSRCEEMWILHTDRGQWIGRQSSQGDHCRGMSHAGYCIENCIALSQNKMFCTQAICKCVRCCLPLPLHHRLDCTGLCRGNTQLDCRPTRQGRHSLQPNKQQSSVALLCMMHSIMSHLYTHIYMLTGAYTCNHVARNTACYTITTLTV